MESEVGPSPSSLCSPHNRPINPRDEVLGHGIQEFKARNTTLFRKPTDLEDGRLMSQMNHLIARSGCQVLL